MKAKNIFKTLAFAMLLTTACNREVIDNENTDQKGYTLLPVTVNVNREGDEDATKATFNDDNKKLSFSTGDKLHVSGIVSSNAFATTKALAVEQFSREEANSYSNGFSLSPQNAILNFTISGLPASTAVDVSLDYNSHWTYIAGPVTTDASGTATFAVGVGGTPQYIDSYTLTVGGNVITLPHKTPEAGHIYNITRSGSPLAYVTDADLGKVIGADGRIYAKASDTTAASTTAVAMIAYVGNASNCSHGLAIAMSDVSGYNWSGAITACSDKNTTAAVTGGTWRLPSIVDWQNMLIGCGELLVR